MEDKGCFRKKPPVVIHPDDVIEMTGGLTEDAGASESVSPGISVVSTDGFECHFDPKVSLAQLRRALNVGQDFPGQESTATQTYDGPATIRKPFRGVALTPLEVHQIDDLLRRLRELESLMGVTTGSGIVPKSRIAFQNCLWTRRGYAAELAERLRATQSDISTWRKDRDDLLRRSGCDDEKFNRLRKLASILSEIEPSQARLRRIADQMRIMFPIHSEVIHRARAISGLVSALSAPSAFISEAQEAINLLKDSFAENEAAVRDSISAFEQRIARMNSLRMNRGEE
jgi:hypothetical protein